jgi:hypothetical protein
VAVIGRRAHEPGVRRNRATASASRVWCSLLTALLTTPKRWGGCHLVWVLVFVGGARARNRQAAGDRGIQTGPGFVSFSRSEPLYRRYDRALGGASAAQGEEWVCCAVAMNGSEGAKEEGAKVEEMA